MAVEEHELEEFVRRQTQFNGDLQKFMSDQHQINSDLVELAKGTTDTLLTTVTNVSSIIKILQLQQSIKNTLQPDDVKKKKWWQL